MRKVLAWVLLLILPLAMLSGCGKKEVKGQANSELLGHWYEKDGAGELDFDESGSFESANTGDFAADILPQAVRYQAGDTEIAFFDRDEQQATATYAIADAELTLTANGNSRVYVRTVPLADEPTTEAPTEAPTTTEPPQTESPEQVLAQSIIGTWSAPYKGDTLIYSFAADGTGSASISGITLPITYSTSDGILTVTGYGFGTSDTGSASFVLEDDTLTATKDGTTLVFTRVG